MTFGTALIALSAYAASPGAVELERLRLQLEKTPTAELELQYLQAFPENHSDFRMMFTYPRPPDEELYKTRGEHLALLEKLAAKHPRRVLELWLGAATSSWQADSAHTLRRQLSAYAAKETQAFATTIMTKGHNPEGVVEFLADVESFTAYENYATILTNLEKLGQARLKTLFLQAKAVRMTYQRSPASVELERLRVQIEANPAAEAELRYLALFPNTFAEFKKTFHNFTPPDVELYHTHMEHLDLLESLAMKHPREVLDLWLNISANATYDADAVGFLQSQISEYAAKETKTFATALMARPDAQRRNIVTFLADLEAISTAKNYATILSNLEKLGQSKLRHLFLDAKTKRMKYRHAPGE